MTREDALGLRDIDSELDGRPNPAEGFPFFATATGSLGQGLSIAAGLALAARLDGLDTRMFCLIGDGESREGQIWEAVDFIADYRLTAVCPIFNCNAYGQSDWVSLQQSPDTMAAKLQAAGFDVRRIDCHHRPNLFIEIPGTFAGVPAIEEMLYEGININITLLFSVRAYEAVARLHQGDRGARGREEARARSGWGLTTFHGRE